MAPDDDLFGGNVRDNTKAWDPSKAADQLLADQVVHDGESEEATVKRLLRDGSAGAVMSILHLAMNAIGEGVRLKAAQYVVDRLLGPNAVIGATEEDELDVLLAKLREAGASPHQTLTRSSHQ